MVTTRNPIMLLMSRKHMWGQVYEPLSVMNAHTTPIFVENSHDRPFSIIPKTNNNRFLTKKWSPPKILECDLRKGKICGVTCTTLSLMINDHTTPILFKNSHERQFSILPNANTYIFFTKNWFRPEMQECDLWQGNTCGVRCTSFWSMMNGHSTPILSKIAMNGHFQ
jgi:hypothetical protein